MRNNSIAAMLAVGTCAAALATSAQAQQLSYDIPAGSLKAALDAYGRRSGRPIVYKADEVRGVQSPGFRGTASSEQALDALLAGTGFAARAGGAGSVAIVRRGTESGASNDASPPSDGAGTQSAATEDESGEIVVTGSHIRGARITSPVIAVTAEEVQRAGQNDLGQVVRSLPQNFNGGQNPGILDGGEAFGNFNSTGGSQINLRGLGPSATLTLLNGRRLPNDSVTQAVDISSIPVGAVERIEVVPDGASALYGSDAVGGVVNVILKRRLDGLTTSARLGGATDGGDFEQQYQATAGQMWGSGGITISGDYSHNTPIYADQRKLTREVNAGDTLLPEQRYYGGVLTADQQIGGSVTLGMDAVYGKRKSHLVSSFGGDDYLDDGVLADTKTRALYISPSIDIELPRRWKAEVYYSYGRDTAAFRRAFFFEGEADGTSAATLRSSTTSYEANAEGPLFSLPAGDVRVALGAGRRTSRFETIQRAGYSASRSSSYGFAEIYAPLASPAQDIAGIDRLALTAAGRLEDYNSGLGRIFTPKLGAVYAPTSDIDIKGSWGRSFKAPTLPEQFQGYSVNALSSRFVGAVGFPPGATFIQLAGGNRELGPERAETFSGTVSLHPSSWPAFRLDVSYFDILYKDRVSTVIPTFQAGLNDPIYASFRTIDPTPAQIDALVAGSVDGRVTNQTGAPFDPSTVAAIVDYRRRNVSREHIRGIDVSASYRFDLGEGAVTASGNLSYLDYQRVVVAGTPYIDISGLIYRPTSLRGRGGLTWESGDLVVSSYVNHVGGVDDDRFSPNPRVDGMTTVDLTIQYSVPVGGSFDGLSIQASVINLFNAMPDRIREAYPNQAPFDSSNYSINGRFVGLTISKSW